MPCASNVFAAGLLVGIGGGLSADALLRRPSEAGPTAEVVGSASDRADSPRTPGGPHTRATDLEGLEKDSEGALAGQGAREDPTAANARAAALWIAVATVRVLSGDMPATRAALVRAAELGADGEQLASVVGLLQADDVAPEIARLLASVPSALANAWALFRLLAEAEPVRLEEAFALAGIVLDRATTAPTQWLPFARVLISLDAARTDAMLVPHADTYSKSDLCFLAHRFLKEGERDLARAWWRRLCARAPEPEDEELELQSLQSAFDPTSAIEALRQRATASTDEPGPWVKLAEALVEAGDPRGAFEAYAQAFSRNANDVTVLGKLVQLDATRALPLLDAAGRGTKNLKLLKLLALGYAKNGLLEKSAECAFQAQEREPADYELLGAIVTLDPARALTRLNDMLSRPTWAEDDEIQGARANALLATGDATGAFEAYAKASSIDPRDTDWLRGLAEADPARALPLLLARQADDPGSDVAAALAIAYATTGAPEPAAAQFHRAVGSSDPSAWCAAAYARVEPEGALAWVTQWVESNPKDADRHAALGDVYRQLGRTEEARAAYAEAERRAPTHVGAALRRVRGR